jgi:cell division protein ZapA
MALIKLTVHGQDYEMACDDGQEGHLRKLAEYIDEKVQGLAESAGQVGEKRMLVMASLLIADELFDAYRQIHGLSTKSDNDSQLAVAIDSCAQRIEAIATRLADA